MNIFSCSKNKKLEIKKAVIVSDYGFLIFKTKLNDILTGKA